MLKPNLGTYIQSRKENLFILKMAFGVDDLFHINIHHEDADCPTQF